MFNQATIYTAQLYIQIDWINFQQGSIKVMGRECSVMAMQCDDDEQARKPDEGMRVRNAE